MRQLYYLYIMASISGTLYTGVTNNIRRRTVEHKRGDSGFTARFDINRLVYYEVFRYVDNAIARETRVKGWRRSKKVALIESLNPSWRDLSVDFGKEMIPSDVLRSRADIALDERFRAGNRDSSSLRSSE